MEKDRKSRAGMAASSQDPPSGAVRPLPRQTPEVGAVCGKPARTDLSGGRSAMDVPTAIEPMAIVGVGRSRAIPLFDSQCARWFLANYEDPVKSTPYDGAQGGYQYQCGGRYSAREELMRRFYAGLETRFRRR